MLCELSCCIRVTLNATQFGAVWCGTAYQRTECNARCGSSEYGSLCRFTPFYIPSSFWKILELSRLMTVCTIEIVLNENIDRKYT